MGLFFAILHEVVRFVGVQRDIGFTRLHYERLHMGQDKGYAGSKTKAPEHNEVKLVAYVLLGASGVAFVSGLVDAYMILVEPVD